MNAHLINAALLARDMLPLDGDCTCPACGETQLTRDEMADREPWMLATYNAAICRICADNHPECAVCGSIVTPDEAVNGMHWYCSDEHAADQDAEHRCDMEREGAR